MFFVGSLIAVPVGPSSVHLLLAGLMGIMLGTATFPAIAIALLLQALLFGFGGLTTLGVNIVNCAMPGVLLGLALGPAIRSTASAGMRVALAAAVGGLAVLGTGGLVALAIGLSSPEYTPVASILLATYVPLAVGRGLRHRGGGRLPRPGRPGRARAGRAMTRLILLCPILFAMMAVRPPRTGSRSSPRSTAMRSSVTPSSSAAGGDGYAVDREGCRRE